MTQTASPHKMSEKKRIKYWSDKNKKLAQENKMINQENEMIKFIIFISFIINIPFPLFFCNILTGH